MKINNTIQFLSFRKFSIGDLILLLAKFLAFSGGIILISMVFLNLLSIIGRVVWGKPIVGDFELIEIACAVSIFMFLPICKLKNGNIIVDSFTLKLNQRKRLFLDFIGDILFGLVALFFSMRMVFGLLDMVRYNEQTMLLEIPLWLPFGPAIVSFLFLSFICFYTVFKNISVIFFVREN